MKFKRDGTFNDIFNNIHNRIPYCVQDLHQLYDQFFDKKIIAMTRPAIQALCQTAHLFIEEITSKPSFLSSKYSKQTLPTQHLLKNIKAKFPEMAEQAEILSKKYLERWRKPIVQELPIDQLVKEKTKKKRLKKKKQQQIQKLEEQEDELGKSSKKLNELRVQRAQKRLERVLEQDQDEQQL